MKILIESTKKLIKEGRWDIDYHLPPEHIQIFKKSELCKVGKIADIVKTKKNPTKKPNDPFLYIDISCIDNKTGIILNPQELIGEEAPSRARKLVRAYDIIISTVRPTRGAIAVVPEYLHGQICSTGFSVIRAKENINPFYLQFALRMQSSLEQFRKFSTGSSYPAILDSDVEKTLIPCPDVDTQDEIAQKIRNAFIQRKNAIFAANTAWDNTNTEIINNLASSNFEQNLIELSQDENDFVYSISEIQERLKKLPPIEEIEEDDESTYEDLTLFDLMDED